MSDHIQAASLRRSLSRRDVLKLSGALAGSSILAACAGTPTAPPATSPSVTSPPAASPVVTSAPAAVQGTVVIMHQRNELSEDEEKQFEADNPGIQIELLAADFTRFFAMYAAGTAETLLITCGAYAVSAPLWWLWRKLRHKQSIA